MKPETNAPQDLAARIADATAAIRKRSALAPSVGIILGTGLGNVSSTVTESVEIPYEAIPHFPRGSVEGHAGTLVLGRIAKTSVVVMNGRAHYYEGYSMQEVSFPVRVMKALGAKVLIVTNATGGMNPLHEPGDIVLVADHINLMGDNPLIGPNDETFGPRFPDMSEPYSRRLLALAEEIALEEKIRVEKGVFVAVAGPNLETRAEYRFLRAIGADVVGMSLVPENLVAVHGGMEVLALAVVTDSCLPDALEPVDIAKILATAARTEPRLTRLVTRVVERLS